VVVAAPGGRESRLSRAPEVGAGWPNGGPRRPFPRNVGPSGGV